MRQSTRSARMLLMSVIVILAAAGPAAMRVPVEAAAPALPAASVSRPIALVGATYGGYDRKLIIDRILAPEGIAYEDKGNYLPVSEFNRYAMVIMLTSTLDAEGKAVSWTAEEIARVGEYIEAGGCLLLTAGLPSGLSRGANVSVIPFLGAKRFNRFKTSLEGEIVNREDPLTDFFEKSSYSWTAVGPALTELTTARALVAADVNGKLSAGVTVNNYGKGSVYYAGWEIFRLFGKGKPADAEAAEYVRLFRKFILECRPLTARQSRAADVNRLLPKGASFITWQDDAVNDYGEVTALDFLSPSQDKLLKSIHLDMAGNELESVFLHVTAAAAPVKLSCTLEGDAFIREAAIFNRTAPLHALLPVDKALDLAPQQTAEIWLRFSSRKAAPGVYRGRLLLRGATGPVTAIPLEVKVWKTAIPEKNLVRMQPYGSSVGFVNGMPIGKVTDERRQDYLDQLQAFFGHMKESRFDVLEWYYNQNTIFSKVLIGERPMFEVLKEKPELLKGDKLPELDFSAYDDYLDIPRSCGFGSYVVVQGPMGLVSVPLRQVGKLLNKEILPGTAEYERYAVWVLTAFRRYLESRGAVKVLAKIDDEISPQEMAGWNAKAALFRRAGWEAFCTWTGGIPRTPENIRQVNANCYQWQLQFLSLDAFRRNVAAEPGLLDAGDEIWYYGGRSNPYRMPYLKTRSMGWIAGYYNVDGFGFWTYRSWHSEGSGVVYYRDKGILGTPASEGLRDAVEDAQLYAMLNRRKGGDKRLWDEKRFSWGLVGIGSGILSLSQKYYSRPENVYYDFDSFTATNAGKARAALLKLLEGTGPQDNGAGK